MTSCRDVTGVSDDRKEAVAIREVLLADPARLRLTEDIELNPGA